ncbi:Integral membrane protein [Histomonas meleagridis]|uniref:Integral membrane protein n=1 Tax=Histomonas meleagridis TaxID=135588 RepID=UPI00355AB00C|nr:Integral membrane protein [Histomonas meleagridis]KAH0804381.1 Integral membrane protein [Histomonas meleagridis]
MEEQPKKNYGYLIAVVFMLIFGTCTSVLMKVMLTLESPGFKGIKHNFDKPFMQSFLMFFGMAFSYFISKVWDPEKKGKKPSTSWSQRIIIAIPAAFDLFASTLMTFGLIYINVSIFQMLRGSMVIFSAIISILFLKRKIPGYRWFSICITIVALVMIGVAGMFVPAVTSSSSESTETTEYSATQKLLGAVLVVLSQLVQAAQIVTEEYVLQDVNMPALEIVGWEGIWGLVLMIVVGFPFALIVPGNDPSPLGKSLENFIDSFIQLFSSGKVLVVCIFFILAVLFYNMFGMLVTSHSSAVNRTILEAARTLFIWIVTLICAYAGAGFGELWVNWSFLELGGFFLLVLATFIYNDVFKLPFFKYDQNDDEQKLVEPLMQE